MRKNRATRIFFYIGIIFESIALGIEAKFTKNPERLKRISTRAEELEDLLNSL